MLFGTSNGAELEVLTARLWIISVHHVPRAEPGERLMFSRPTCRCDLFDTTAALLC
jgi:hypothetical protein